jgi:uncharacterized protein (DUF302 family)
MRSSQLRRSASRLPFGRVGHRDATEETCGRDAERGFTVFNVIDHSGVAERAGVLMPDSKLVILGKPNVGAAVMSGDL